MLKGLVDIDIPFIVGDFCELVVIGLDIPEHGDQIFSVCDQRSLPVCTNVDALGFSFEVDEVGIFSKSIMLSRLFLLVVLCVDDKQVIAVACE